MQKQIIKIEHTQKLHTPLYLELSISQQPISFKAKLLAWSNAEQKLVTLKESVIAEFLVQDEYEKLSKKCSAVLEAFIAYLTNTVQTPHDLELFIKRLEPSYIFHPHLLKAFQVCDLKRIMDTHFEFYPILNAKDFSSFLPNKIDGWFISDLMEVDVTADGVYLCDMQSSKPKQLTPDEVLQRLDIEKTDTNSILQLCAKKWIAYCGLSLSTRTLYWDIALAVCKDPDIFEKSYILSYDGGEESLHYDISPTSNLNFYERIKEQELQCLTQEESKIFMCGYNLLVADLETDIKVSHT